ncbi:MAG: hypothetical protein AAF799_19770 [Myxococcota bacterium]
MAATACDTETAGVDEVGSTFRASILTSDFALRVGDMAMVALRTYATDPTLDVPSISQPVDLGGKRHVHRADLSARKVQVYQYANGNEHSIIIGFRGTAETSWRDWNANASGMTSRIQASNPWIEQHPGADALIPGQVGKGFHQRVSDYMWGEADGCGDGCGMRLRTVIADILDDPNARLDVHVTGHSLGGISSQLFSMYAYRYLTFRGYDRSRFRVFNFAFNSPKTGDCVFVGEFADNVGAAFIPFNFTRDKDPVSTWAPFIHWLGFIDQPNDLDPFLRGRPIGYCPHAQLPAKTPSISVDNHAIDEDVIREWEGAMGADFGPSILEDVSVCMKAAYQPVTVSATQ